MVATLVATVFTSSVGLPGAGAAPVVPPNACLGLTGTISDLPIPITATSPASVTLGDTAVVSGLSITIAITPELVGAGIGAGAVQYVDSLALLGGAGGTDGRNLATVPVGQATLDVTGTNTLEGTQRASNVASASAEFWVVNDPITAVVTIYQGAPGSFTVVPMVVVSMPLGDLTFTGDADGGDMVFSQQLSAPLSVPPNAADKTNADLRIIATLGALTVPFHCWLGTENTPANGALNPAASSPALTTTTVIAPPTAPTCTGDAPSVPAGQSVDIDFTIRCTDVNGNGTIDWNTIGFGWGNPAAPTVCVPALTAGVCVLPAGTLTAAIGPTGFTGVFSYTNTDTAATSELFGFTVGDMSCSDDSAYNPLSGCTAPATQRRSSTALINIGILQGVCQVVAPATSCDVSQILQLNVQSGNTLKMSASSTSFVTLTTVTLNGAMQLTGGALNSMEVLNSRGSSAGWSVTGSVTDFRASTYSGTGCSGATGVADRLCIPATNLSWQPSAAITHTVIPGDVAVVDAGGSGSATTPWTTGLYSTGAPSSSSSLCSAASNHSGGTFSCGAGLVLGVPASAGADQYEATLTLTLA